MFLKIWTVITSVYIYIYIYIGKKGGGNKSEQTYELIDINKIYTNSCYSTWYIYIYIYIYRRERERERERRKEKSERW